MFYSKFGSKFGKKSVKNFSLAKNLAYVRGAKKFAKIW